MLSNTTDVRSFQYYAAGAWRDAASGQVFAVREPYTGQVYAEVAACGPDDARLAVQAAADAFPAWSDTTPGERARCFLKAGEIVKRRRTEIAEILARETGSTISFATFQQDLVAATGEITARHERTFAPFQGVKLATTPSGRRMPIEWTPG